MKARHLASLAMLVVVPLLPAASHAAPPPPITIPSDGVYVYQVVRTSNAPRRLVMEVDAKAHHERGDLYMIGLVGSGRSRRVLEDHNNIGYLPVGPGSPWPTVYGPGDALPRCPDGPTCRSSVPFGRYVKVDSDKPLALTYLVASAYSDTKITVTEPGWRIQKTSLGFRRVYSDDSAAAGLRFGTWTVEHFVQAEVPGGKFGSSVFASIPCSNHGVGEATLTGAPKPVRLWCTEHPLGSHFSEYADVFTQTTWRLRGDVTGWSGMPTRLAVLDFPKG